MIKTENVKCTYTTHYGLTHGENLTNNEIANGILLGVIEPVMKYGIKLYNYNPEEIMQLFLDDN